MRSLNVTLTRKHSSRMLAARFCGSGRCSPGGIVWGVWFRGMVPGGAVLEGMVDGGGVNVRRHYPVRSVDRQRRVKALPSKGVKIGKGILDLHF